MHVKALVDYSLGMGPLYPVLEIHLVDMNVDMLFAIKQAYEDWASSPGLQDMAEKYKTGKRYGAVSTRITAGIVLILVKVCLRKFGF